ncbi:MAG: pilus assembly protein N-terminal domain-containing protein [Verrucomicrobiota bacterium]
MKQTNKNTGYRGMVTIIMTVMVAWSLGSSLQAQSENAIRVNSGEAVTLAAESVTKLAIADPSIADVVALSDKEISIIGKKIGGTTLTIVRQDKPTQVYRIEVGNDMTATLIRKMVGSSTIVVRNVGDTVILDGYVNDEIEAQRAAQIAGAVKGQQVVNLIEVRKPRQIRIRTRVVEVNSDAVKNVGFRWNGAAGEVEYALDYTTGGSIISGLTQPLSSGVQPTTPNALDIGASVVMQLLVEKGYAKLLSEPTLTTLSGKEASFLVGDEIPIVQQLPNSYTVEFKEVGVRMKIKPTADSQNQINTVIHAEVSQIVGPGANGIPIIGTKKADTTLQAKDGQTIVIGGLLENQINRDYLRKVPWLADIPIFGFLFRHKEFGQKQREVIFFMTPEIVKDDAADVAAAAKTPAMKDWNKVMMDNILDVPKKGSDWGMQDFKNFGFPESDSKAAAPAKTPASTSATQPASAATPATAVPAAVEPTNNFTPARPTGQ